MGGKWTYKYIIGHRAREEGLGGQIDRGGGKRHIKVTRVEVQGLDCCEIKFSLAVVPSLYGTSEGAGRLA